MANPPLPSSLAEGEDAKIDRIISLLTDIRDAVHPPAWKQGTRFFFTHIWKVLALVLMAYYLSQGAAILSGFANKMDGTEEGLVRAKDEAMKKLEDLQFWKSSE